MKASGGRVIPRSAWLILAVMVLLSGTSALAQNYAPEPQRVAPAMRPGVLDAPDVRALLQRRGYRDIEIRRQRGVNYVVGATGRRGNPVVIVLDGRTGEIIGLRATGRSLDTDEGAPRPWSGPRW